MTPRQPNAESNAPEGAALSDEQLKGYEDCCLDGRKHGTGVAPMVVERLIGQYRQLRTREQRLIDAIRNGLGWLQSGTPDDMEIVMAKRVLRDALRKP